MLLAISRASLQADPLQLSNQQPLKSNTEPQEAASACFELAADEGLCSLHLERLFFSFLVSFTAEIRVDTDLEIMLGE